MKKLKGMLFGVVAALAFTCVAGVSVHAETFKKLHSAPQKVLTDTNYIGTVSSVTATVDLSGGDLDKVSAMVKISSSTTGSTASLDIDMEVSPDGGTTWGSAGGFTQITSTSTSAVYTFKQNFATGPGTKFRLRFRGATASWWLVNAWVLPSVD